MLVKFTVSNFLSFKEAATLDLTAESLKEKKGYLHIPYFYNSELSLVKSLCIYGHNSHGKSNLIKAYHFFQKFVQSSFSLNQTKDAIELEPFALNSSMINKPSYFEIVFILKETKYRYGFKLTSEQIVEEWLYYAEPKIRENILFHRVGQEYRDTSKVWNKESENRIEVSKPFAKERILFLSVLVSQDNIPRIDLIGKWLNGNLIISNTNYDRLLDINGGAKDIYSQLEYRDAILKFIKPADIGFTTIFDKISDISRRKGYDTRMINDIYEREQKEFELYTQHDIYNSDYKKEKTIEFLLRKNESSGSIKYFIMSCFLVKAIREGQLIWIDELDSSLHTDLFLMLIKTFNDPNNNTRGSQLVFTTHNTVMLNRQLRRDQITFVHKNNFGESYLQPLHTSESPVRIGKSVEQEYREGNLNKGASKNIDRENPPNLFSGL